jgi:ATP-binding cassette, subfamily B, bacterial
MSPEPPEETPSSEDANPPVDALDLLKEARSQPRSAGQLGRLLRRSLRIAWDADRRLLLLTAGLQLVGGLVALVQILIIKDVLSSVISVQGTQDRVDRTLVPVAFLALTVGISTVSSAAQQQLQRLLAELVTRRTWDGILDVTSTVALRQYDTPAFYDHLQRVQTNAIGRPYVLTQALVSLVGSLASSVALVAAVLALQPVLLPLILLSSLPLYIATRKGSNLEFRFAVAQTPRLRLRSYLQIVQTGRDEAKELRAFGSAPALRARYAAVYASFIADLRGHIRRRSIIALVSGAGSALALAFTMFAIVWLVAHNDLSLAAAGAALVAVRALAGQISGVFTSVQQIFESGLFLGDLDRFLATESAGQPVTEGRLAPAGFDQLDVEGLSFTYPGSTKPALTEVDLHVRRGDVVALVGENGSGKTTLAKLLAALYAPDEGSIRWDGVDVSEYDPTGLRRSIGVIFQDFVQYQLSAKANIAMGRPEADETDPQIVAAAQASGADQIIEALPHGYDTILSNAFSGGRNLSGGQWQRVALARAFYRDSPLVILDEPSAALDPRAEHELFTSLREILAGRTVLYISHRLSTVREADRIYVLAGGRIAEQGTHDELMASGGRYSELFTLQAAAYIDRPD